MLLEIIGKARYSIILVRFLGHFKPYKRLLVIMCFVDMYCVLFHQKTISFVIVGLHGKMPNILPFEHKNMTINYVKNY